MKLSVGIDMHPPDYIPALGYDLLTPPYDPFLRWLMREARFKRRLVDQAEIRSDNRVLDLGCRTGRLAIMTKQLHPEAEVAGLDGDAKVLEIARAKAAKGQRNPLKTRLDDSC